MTDTFKLDSTNYWKQIVYDQVPIGSLITQRCGCVLKVVEGTKWNYPTFIPVQLCHESAGCQLKHRRLGMEMWDFYETFDHLDMEASFGISDEEAQVILAEWKGEVR